MSSEPTPPVVPDATPAMPAPLARWKAAAAALLVAAAVTRFADLGHRPLHHDESIHAFQSYTLSQNGEWRYDPAYHGPFLYYANAVVYKILGATDTTARLLPAFFGILLILFAVPLRRWIGDGAAAAYALLVLVSPHLAYFSRFIREDLYSLVFTLATILCFRMFVETDRARWLTAAAAAFAFAGVTKENAYMTGVLFVAFGVWTFLVAAVRNRKAGGSIGNTAAATGAWIRRNFAALATAAIVFLAIWEVMYTGLLTHKEDWWTTIPKAIHYWMGQHAIARIPGPWYYYFPQLLYYETATVLAAAFALRRRKLDPFLSFVLFWTIGSIAIYSWAREKVPWLTVHPLLPLTLLAAVGLANLWRDRRERAPRIALAVFALLLAINTSGMLLACFRYGAYDLERRPKNGEYLAYVQTTEDLVRALGVLDRVKGRVPAGQNWITVAGEASWPLTWYLRNTPTAWTPRIDRASTPVIVADWDPEGALEKQLANKYDAKRVPIRAWWFPEKSPGTPENPGSHPTLKDAWNWWLFHRLWSPIGSQDATFFVRKDLASASVLEPLQLPIQDTTGRDYPSDPSLIPPERTWGGPGSGDGQFAEPRGIAVDGRGNVYVADSKNSRIEVLDPSGRFLRAFGRKGGGDGELNEPCGLTVDSEGDVWVADTWNHRVVHFSSDGQFRGAFGDPDRSLFGPRAAALAKGVLYVVDTGNKRIVRFDRSGKKLSEFGEAGNGPGQLVEPVGIASNYIGEIVVADTGNHRVQYFDPEGKFLRQFPVSGWKDFYTEPYLAVGPGDVVILTDAWSGRVAVYEPGGALRRSFKAPADWKQPTGIAIDPFGRLNVSDRGTNRIFSWTLASVLP